MFLDNSFLQDRQISEYVPHLTKSLISNRYSLQSGMQRSRRRFLKESSATAGIGVSTLMAGCLGDEGKTSWEVGTTTPDTGIYAISEVMASIITEHSDSLDLDARPTSGSDDAFGQWNSGELDICHISNDTANRHNLEMEPYYPLDREMNLLFNVYTLPWFFVSPELTSMEDIDGHSISPTQSGASARPILEGVLDIIIEDYSLTSVNLGDQGSAFTEGRLDVGIGTIYNYDLSPSWQEQMKSQSDLNILEWPDDMYQQISNEELYNANKMDNDWIPEGWNNVPEEVVVIPQDWWFQTANEMDYDLVYEFLEVLHSNNESFADGHALAGQHLDDEWWVSNAPDLPFHPAAADYYEEIGVWDSEFSRASE